MFKHLLLVVFISTQAFAQTEVQIGYVAGLSGPGVGETAQAAYKVLKAYVDQVNKSGELKNYKLVVKSYDNEFEPSKNLEIVSQMAQDKISVVTGIHYSNDALVIAPILEQKSIPTIVTTATHPDIVAGRKFIHRISFSDNDQARVLGQGLLSKSKGRIFIIKDVKNSFSITLTELVAKHIKRVSKKREVIIIDVERGHIDGRSLLEKFKDVKIDDGLLITTNVPDSALILKELNKAGKLPVIFGSDAWASLEIEEALASYNLVNISAYYTSLIIPNAAVDQWRELQAVAKSANVQINSYLADPIVTFEAAKIIIKVLKQMPVFDILEFNRRIRLARITGPYGEVRLAKNGESLRSPVLVKIRNSKIMGPD